MTRTFFTQSEWFGIDFDTLGLELNPQTRPTSQFYETFYEQLHRQFPSVEDLPASWRANKKATAAAIASLVDPDSRVLSYGSGTGFVEDCLIREFGFARLSLFDQAPASSQYFPHMSTRYWRPGQIGLDDEAEPPFDVVYLCQVLYALDDSEVVETLSLIGSWMSPRGMIISIDTSLKPEENGLTQGGRLKRRLVRAVRPMARFATLPMRRFRRDRTTRSGQGWGWQRDNAELASLFHAAGLHELCHSHEAGQALLIARVPA